MLLSPTIWDCIKSCMGGNSIWASAWRRRIGLFLWASCQTWQIAISTLVCWQETVGTKWSNSQETILNKGLKKTKPRHVSSNCQSSLGTFTCFLPTSCPAFSKPMQGEQSSNLPNQDPWDDTYCWILNLADVAKSMPHSKGLENVKTCTAILLRCFHMFLANVLPRIQQADARRTVKQSNTSASFKFKPDDAYCSVEYWISLMLRNVCHTARDWNRWKHVISKL